MDVAGEFAKFAARFASKDARVDELSAQMVQLKVCHRVVVCCAVALQTHTVAARLA